MHVRLQGAITGEELLQGMNCLRLQPSMPTTSGPRTVQRHRRTGIQKRVTFARPQANRPPPQPGAPLYSSSDEAESSIPDLDSFSEGSTLYVSTSGSTLAPPPSLAAVPQFSYPVAVTPTPLSRTPAPRQSSSTRALRPRN